MTTFPEFVLLSRRDAVATVTLNRPDVLNAIDLDTCRALRARLAEVARDPGVRAVVLTGGGRAFCAGGDLRFARAANPDRLGDSFLALTDVLHACVAEVRRMSKPVVAAINGPAAGAGFFLALACDLRVMGDGAYLKQSNTSHGLSVPAGGTFTLPRLVGLARALEITMLDEPIPAARALELGLVTRVAPHDRLPEEAFALAARAAAMPVGALGRVKQLMDEAFHSTLEEQLRSERREIAASADSGEGREGVAAFLEKRRPDFAAAAQRLVVELTDRTPMHAC